jgi:hypothetical protein
MTLLQSAPFVELIVNANMLQVLNFSVLKEKKLQVLDKLFVIIVLLTCTLIPLLFDALPFLTHTSPFIPCTWQLNAQLVLIQTLRLLLHLHKKTVSLALQVLSAFQVQPQIVLIQQALDTGQMLTLSIQDDISGIFALLEPSTLVLELLLLTALFAPLEVTVKEVLRLLLVRLVISVLTNPLLVELGTQWSILVCLVLI